MTVVFLYCSPWRILTIKSIIKCVKPGTFQLMCYKYIKMYIFFESPHMHFGYSIYEYGYLYNDHIPNDHHGSHGSADDDDDAGQGSDSDSESDSDDDVSADVDALVLLLFALPITLSGPREFCYIRPKGNFYYFYRFVVGKNSILAIFFLFVAAVFRLQFFLGF